ncbi:hypothetical protein OCK74_24910 [Chitinophagaceae bacterium LB-8]|uniref:Beta-lactamase-inhibitor-like PepSY-like domain-containing protein n=1 Tax=Paraflavisolibacter caeni TaxID=2982496 RepID=A0A9X3BHH8_9BACT|nr:hypothetical protein [Paraflavisolibacter caeni]MCU7552384.1 hypothetical protein [Paraflavisolibacter caeni]
MKKILLGLAFLLSTTAFALDNDIDETIAKRFHETFPTATNIKWYTYEDYYEVFFDYNQVTCRIHYDLKGNVISVRRDYSEKDLPVFILAKLKQKYPNKKVFGVTEILSGDEVVYEIVLEDAKTWTRVNSDAHGSMYVTKKFKKA